MDLFKLKKKSYNGKLMRTRIWRNLYCETKYMHNNTTMMKCHVIWIYLWIPFLHLTAFYLHFYFVFLLVCELVNVIYFYILLTFQSSAVHFLTHRWVTTYNFRQKMMNLPPKTKQIVSIVV